MIPYPTVMKERENKKIVLYIYSICIYMNTIQGEYMTFAISFLISLKHHAWNDVYLVNLLLAVKTEMASSMIHQ